MAIVTLLPFVEVCFILSTTFVYDRMDGSWTKKLGIAASEERGWKKKRSKARERAM